MCCENHVAPVWVTELVGEAVVDHGVVFFLRAVHPMLVRSVGGVLGANDIHEHKAEVTAEVDSRRTATASRRQHPHPRPLRRQEVALFEDVPPAGGPFHVPVVVSGREEDVSVAAGRDLRLEYSLAAASVPVVRRYQSLLIDVVSEVHDRHAIRTEGFDALVERAPQLGGHGINDLVAAVRRQLGRTRVADQEDGMGARSGAVTLESRSGAGLQEMGLRTAESHQQGTRRQRRHPRVHVAPPAVCPRRPRCDGRPGTARGAWPSDGIGFGPDSQDRLKTPVSRIGARRIESDSRLDDDRWTRRRSGRF